MVTVPVGPSGQQLREGRLAEVAARPRALAAATPLLLTAGLPFLLLGLAAAALPERRWMPYTGPWPQVRTGPVGYRVLGGGMLLLALGYLVLVVLAHRRRHRARVAAVTLIALGDPALGMVLLADPLRPGWLALAAAVVVCSLAGVACCYQPEVDRHLADHGRHAC